MTANHAFYLSEHDVVDAWASATGRFETAEFTALTNEWHERARANAAQQVSVERVSNFLFI